MCASGGNAQCDSMMDRKVITKTLSDLKETIEKIGPKVERVQTLAKDMHSRVEKVNCLETLKLDLSEDFQSLEELFNEMKKPLYTDFELARETYVKSEIVIHADYQRLLYTAEGADVKPSNAAILRKVLEALKEFVEFTNKGLDKALWLVECAERETEDYLKDQGEMRGDVRKRFADLKELVKTKTHPKDS